MTDATTTNEEPRPFNRMLRVRLTPEERLALATGREAAEAERDRVTAEFEELKESYRDRMKRLDERISKARADFATGTEERAVACIEEPLFDQNAVLVRRLDTGEVIDKRAMEGDDRQLEIDLPINDVHDGPGEGGGAPGAGGAPSLWMVPNVVASPAPALGQLWVPLAPGHEGTVLQVAKLDGSKVQLRRGEVPWRKEAGGPPGGSYDVASPAWTKRLLKVEAERLERDYAFLRSAHQETPPALAEVPAGTVATTSAEVKVRRGRRGPRNGAADRDGDGQS